MVANVYHAIIDDVRDGQLHNELHLSRVMLPLQIEHQKRQITKFLDTISKTKTYSIKQEEAQKKLTFWIRTSMRILQNQKRRQNR